MGMTFVSAFAPFVFLMPNVRAQVLLPFSLAKPYPRQKTATEIRLLLPKLRQSEPEEIIIGEFESGNKPFLEVYGTNLDLGTPNASFGNIELDIPGHQGNLLRIDLSPVYANPELADHISIVIETNSREESRISIPVINNFPAQPAFLPSPQPPQAPSSPPISQQDIESLITRWLKAKQRIFAPPFDQQLVSELTTGKLLFGLLDEPSSPMKSLQSKNSYYQYDSQSVQEIEISDYQDGQVTVVATVNESRVLYENGKISPKGTDSEPRRIRYILENANGVWKISSIEPLNTIRR
jgi:hypothetical protein